MFDQVLEKSINIYNTKLVSLDPSWNVFIFYLFCNVDIDILFYNLGETYMCLFFTKIDAPYILERRDYYVIHTSK